MGEESLDTSAVPETREQAEALIEAFQSPSPQGEEQIEGTEKAAETPNQYKINFRGKEETYPLEKLIEFAQQGRDYSSKMHDFRVQRDLFERDRQKYAQIEKEYADTKAKFQRYAEVEAYIQKDPNWWQHVQTSYQQRGTPGQGPQGTPDIVNHPFVQNLVKEVEGLKGFATTMQEREAVETRSKEDAALDGEITSYREKFPAFDWKSVDEQGLDLEKRILKHAVDNKIQSFKAAANDFLFEEHVNRAKVQEKESVGKQIQKQQKLGLGPVTTRPVLKMEAVKNVRSKSWDELAEEAKVSAGLV